MSTGIQACDIVLPGYVLSERIGSGGYAEVWRAEAPGASKKQSRSFTDTVTTNSQHKS